MPLFPRVRLSALLLLVSPALAPAQSATVPASSPPAAATAAATPAQTYFAGKLVNDARDDLRNPDLPPSAAAVRATVLLQFAHKLDPADLATLHLLAQTAQAAGDTDVRRSALRQIIAADPGDLVAQVRYIDLLADDTQRLEDRMAHYQAMLAQSELDAQVRSEMALRLARLAEARGDAAGCRDYLAQAVKLNDLNIGALRDWVRLAAAESGPDALPHYLQALCTLLNANPYQPDLWLDAARLAQAGGIHDRAAEFLDTATDQYRNIAGGPALDELYLELGIQWAIARQFDKAHPLLEHFAALPDGPFEALLVDELLTSIRTFHAESRVGEIRKRLAEMVKDAPNASTLADAAGVDLTILPAPGPDTPGWIDSYAKLVAPDDPTLIRLQGWLLFRQNKFDQAQAVLEKSDDPLAKLCRARMLLAAGHADAAATILQELWNADPTGFLALQIGLTAERPELKAIKFTLADSPAAKRMRPLVARLTPALENMHRHPGDAQAVAVRFRKADVEPGEPVLLQVRMTNALDRAVPVGPEGMIVSLIGLAGGLAGQSAGGAATRQVAGRYGIYALEDMQRVYRLEAHHFMETTIRADQGRIADFFDREPGAPWAVSVSLVVAPRILTADEFGMGLAGQRIDAGQFREAGLGLSADADFERLIQGLTALTGERQLVRIAAAAALTTASKGQPVPAMVARLADALAGLAGSKDPLVRVAVLRTLPPKLPASLEKALAPLAADPDPLVRLYWARHQARIVSREDPTMGAERSAALAGLDKLSTSEKDPLVSRYVSATLPILPSVPQNP